MILTTRPLKYLDQLGATLSLACALHCALQPVLLLTLPLLGLGFLLNETLETVFLTISLTLAAWAFFSGYTHHHRLSIFGFWALATLLIGFSRIPLLKPWEIPLAVSGALALMSGHLLNQFHLRQSHLPVVAVHETVGTGILSLNESVPARCNSHRH